MPNPTSPSPVTTPPIVRVTRYLPLIEKVLLTVLAIGLMLTALKIETTVTIVSLIGLAATFFLLAYRPLDIPEGGNEQGGFSDLLALMIIPKVLWISCAITAFGLALFMLETGNDGYKNMLMIGGSTIAVATLLLAFFRISGVKHIALVSPILMRALPLFLAAIYVFFR